jgi:hypothetical protein
VPNQDLAKQITAKNDKAGVQELVDHLSHKSKDIQNDCIKVLYEIGVLKPALIASYAKVFLALLVHKNNRLQWGGMTALSCITLENPKAIYAALPKIMDAANNGSVITRDQAVNILIKLCSVKQYADAAFTLLVEQLTSCPTNQLPMYAENSIPVINEKNKARFIKALSSRFDDLEKDTQRKRIEKVIKKVNSK